MDIASVTEILAASPMFRTLDADLIRQIAESARRVALQKGQLLFSKGEAADAAYVVLNGEISIETVSGDGRIARFATMKKGDLFGELAVLDSGERTADARAQEATALLRISKAGFEKFAAANPEMPLAIIADLVRKLRESNDQIEGIALRRLSARLAQLLLKLAEDDKSSPPQIRMTQSELADRLSATREKVNVHLQSFRAAGAIAISRGRIEFLDLDRLADFADGE